MIRYRNIEMGLSKLVEQHGKQIAAEAGYRSQAAFSRAFLRKYGVRPGKLRHAARAAAVER